jgi:hypothetical protein
VAAWAQDIICNIYLEKKHKTANNSTATVATGKINPDEIL